MARTIDNPVLNGPYTAPKRHLRFDDDGITDEIVDGRRPSAYFVPIARPRKRDQQVLDDQTADRSRENDFVNQVRGRVTLWRDRGWPGTTATTRWLLDYWTREDRERRLFFCQVEALETAIYLHEAAAAYNDTWIAGDLRALADDANPGLDRVALKMATGTGKTVVMAMLIAWQALNKLANPYDRRFTDAFLVVTPGITVRDRLRVLQPSSPDNYYRERDLLPAARLAELGQARIVITNFHAFLLRETQTVSKVARAALGTAGATSPFTETPQAMVRRVCRGLGTRRGILVLNDEAHHCYRQRADDDDKEVPESADEKAAARQRERDARVWISGLEAVQAKRGIRTVYDLSATPFFLRGSGYQEGTLFPWVVSDFSLIDAIESGLVKIPRVPVADDAGVGDLPTYRDLWPHIRDQLPRKGRKTAAVSGDPRLPAKLQSALHSLYGDYEVKHAAWRAAEAEYLTGSTPPVLIVVCNNTNVSKLVFDYVAGYERELPDGAVVAVPGALPLFSNVADGAFTSSPSTILVDSSELESGEGLSPAFKRVAAREIEEFKSDYARRFPGRDPDAVSDEELLREVLNTVGKPGRLGERITCVVSVSMLTEGWDANTVTHILGVRAFGTQLLCEQVVGRGLRRRSYELDADGRLPPEYAEVYGVPFSFIPTTAAPAQPQPSQRVTRVRALPERNDAEIRFPRVAGYRVAGGPPTLLGEFDESARLVLSARDVPTSTQLAPIAGLSTVHDLDGLRRVRPQTLAYQLAERLAQRWGPPQELEGSTVPPRPGDGPQPWLFPQLLAITRRWLEECVECKDGTFPQLLALHERRDDAVDRIARAIAAAADDGAKVVPILRPYDPVGSTRHVDFDTAKPVWVTAEKCHVSHVPADSNWEHVVAESLERMDEVVAYVKNDHLDFAIPYSIDGRQRDYLPDLILRVDDGGREPLNLVVEVSGAERRDKQAKVATATAMWVPAVNAHGGLGRWDFVELTDPWDTQRVLRSAIWRPRIDLPMEAIAALAREYHVRELALFGSVLRSDFRPDSDIDVLVDFDPAARVSLLTMAGVSNDLSDLLGRPVDVGRKRSLRPFLRDEVLRTMRVIYDAA